MSRSFISIRDFITFSASVKGIIFSVDEEVHASHPELLVLRAEEPQIQDPTFSDFKYIEMYIYVDYIVDLDYT